MLGFLYSLFAGGASIVNAQNNAKITSDARKYAKEHNNLYYIDAKGRKIQTYTQREVIWKEDNEGNTLVVDKYNGKVYGIDIPSRERLLQDNYEKKKEEQKRNKKIAIEKGEKVYTGYFISRENKIISKTLRVEDDNPVRERYESGIGFVLKDLYTGLLLPHYDVEITQKYLDDIRKRNNRYIRCNYDKSNNWVYAIDYNFRSEEEQFHVPYDKFMAHAKKIKALFDEEN